MAICDNCNEIDCCCDRPIVFSPENFGSDNFICISTSSRFRKSRLCLPSHSEQENRLVSSWCIQHQRCISKELIAYVTYYNNAWVFATLIWKKLVHYRDMIFTVYSEIVMKYVFHSLCHRDILLMPCRNITAYNIIEGNRPLYSIQINHKIDYPKKENKQTLSTTSAEKYVFGKCKKGLRIAHLNIQHIIPKLDEIKYYLSNYKSNFILGLCETFLTESVNENTLQLKIL